MKTTVAAPHLGQGGRQEGSCTPAGMDNTTAQLYVVGTMLSLTVKDRSSATALTWACLLRHNIRARGDKAAKRTMKANGQMDCCKH